MGELAQVTPTDVPVHCLIKSERQLLEERCEKAWLAISYDGVAKMTPWQDLIGIFCLLSSER